MLAKRFRLPLQEFRRKTTSSEFIRWLVFFKEEVNHFHREDYYWAQIAWIIGNMFVKDDEQIPLEKFLLKFKEKEVEEDAPIEENFEIEFERTPEESEEMIKEIAEKSRRLWYMALGLGPDGKPARGRTYKKKDLPSKDKK